MPRLEEISGRAKPEEHRSRHQSTQKKEPSQYLTKRRRFSFELFVKQQALSVEPLPPWIQETRKRLCLRYCVWCVAARSATISRRTECLTSRVRILQHRPSQIQCPALSLNPNPRLSDLRESQIGWLSRKLSGYRVTHEGGSRWNLDNVKKAISISKQACLGRA